MAVASTLVVSGATRNGVIDLKTQGPNLDPDTTQTRPRQEPADSTIDDGAAAEDRSLFASPGRLRGPCLQERVKETTTRKRKIRAKQTTAVDPCSRFFLLLPGTVTGRGSDTGVGVAVGSGGSQSCNLESQDFRVPPTQTPLNSTSPCMHIGASCPRYCRSPLTGLVNGHRLCILPPGPTIALCASLLAQWLPLCRCSVALFHSSRPCSPQLRGSTPGFKPLLDELVNTGLRFFQRTPTPRLKPNVPWLRYRCLGLSIRSSADLRQDARKSRDLELHCLDDPSNIGRPQEGGQCSAGAVEKIENERILDAGYDHCTSTG